MRTPTSGKSAGRGTESALSSQGGQRPDSNMAKGAHALIAGVLLAAVHDARAVEMWVAATDARVQVVGRYRADADGSVSFDWEGVYALVNVQGAT